MHDGCRLYPAELLGRTNEALPLMMKRLLPPGLLGLNLAATVAACMSSLDSVFTAAASLFCLDVYKQHLRPAATEAELVRAGRWSAPFPPSSPSPLLLFLPHLVLLLVPFSPAPLFSPPPPSPRAGAAPVASPPRPHLP